MKRIVVLYALLTLVAGCEMFTNKPVSVSVVVIADHTDTFIAQPDSAEILNLFDFSNVNNGGIFRYERITDVSFNRVSEAEIKPVGNDWDSNQFEREDSISQFRKQVRDMLSDTSEIKTLDHSSVYRPFASELNHLAKSTANKKYIVVYSDLMENSLDLSFYKPKTFRLLSSNLDSVGRMLDREVHIESLAGITIYLLYQPQNDDADMQYHIVSEFYRRLLEQKGAHVEIAANINK